MGYWIRLVASFFLLVTLASANLEEWLTSQDDLQEFLGLITTAGLTDVINNSANITILAPVNDGIPKSEASIFSWILDESDENLGSLRAYVLYHVVKGTYPSSAFSERPTFMQTMFDSSVSRSSYFAYTNVTRGQYVEGFVRDDKTTFVSGLFQESNMLEPDAYHENGVTVHKVDAAFILPTNVTATCLSLPLEPAAGAISNAFILNEIDDYEDITLFLPSSDALQADGVFFEDAPKSISQQIMFYHLVPGTILHTTDISNTTIQTTQGSDLTFTIEDGVIFVNTAKIIVSNIILSNGVAHVIDTVLNPNVTKVNRASLDPAAAPTPVFPNAVEGTSVPFTWAFDLGYTTTIIPDFATETLADAATTNEVAGTTATPSGSSSNSSSSALSCEHLYTKGVAITVIVSLSAGIMGFLLICPR